MVGSHNVDLQERVSKYPVGSFGHIDHESYLLVLYRRFTRLLRNTPTPLEATLMYTSEILQRLRNIMDTPHAERGPLFLTKPQVGKTHREWGEEEFQFFENLDWAKILPQAFHLYQLQECVCLWGARSSPNVAIALTLWAIQAVKKEIVPSFSLLMEELAAPYGQQKWVAQERFKEMRNLLVAWSTSIIDAGLTFPLLPLPPKGVIGDGVAGYGSDHRRGIPEMDMAVAVLPILSDNWRRILKARFRTRRDIMPLSDEVYLARKMFVLRCEAYATLLNPKDNIPPHLRAPAQGRGAGRANPAIKKFKAYAEQARKEIDTFEPLIRVRIDPIVGSLETPDNAHSPNPQGIANQREQSLSVQALSVESANSRDGEVNEDQFTTLIEPSPSKSGDVQRAIASPINELEMERDQPAPQTDDRSTTLALAASRQSIPASRGQSVSSSSSATGRLQRVYPAPLLRPSPPPNIYTASPTPLIKVPDPRTASSRMPFSLADSSARQNNQTDASDDAHVGILIRERDEYIKFRYSTYLETGHVVSPACEAFMWQWLHRQVDNHSMPTIITAEYLSSIGIKGDPRQIDLGLWIESKKGVWSPVECLLRAGIKPNEIPQQHVPHSLLHLKFLLNNYLEYQSGTGVLAPVGEGIDDDQLEEELDLLFDKDGGDSFGTIFLSPSEVEKRKKEYKKMGIFDDEEDMDAWRSGHVMRSVQATSYLEGQEEEQSTDEDYFAPIPIPSPSRSGSPRLHSPVHEVEDQRHVVRQDIERIRSAATRKNKDELEALLKSLGEGEDLDAEAEKYEALLGGIVVNEADMGLGFDEEDEHDEEDDWGKKKGKGKGKDVSNTASKRKKLDDEKSRKDKKRKTA